MNKKYMNFNFTNSLMCLEDVVYLHFISGFEGNKESVLNCRALGAQSNGSIKRKQCYGGSSSFMEKICSRNHSVLNKVLQE